MMKQSTLILIVLCLTVAVHAEVRTWTNGKGVSLEAEFISQTDGVAKIRRVADRQIFESYWKYTENLKISTAGGKSWESATLPAPVGVTCIVFAEGFPSF